MPVYPPTATIVRADFLATVRRVAGQLTALAGELTEATSGPQPFAYVPVPAGVELGPDRMAGLQRELDALGREIELPFRIVMLPEGSVVLPPGPSEPDVQNYGVRNT